MKVARHRLEGTIAELRATLEKAAAEDDVAEAAIRAGRSRGCLGCGVLALAVGVPLFVADSMPRGSLPILWLLVVPVALWALWAIVTSRKQVARGREEDLDDARLQALQRLLGVLRADVSPKARLKVDVDWREPCQGEYVAAQASQGKQVWRQPWLVLRVRLLDGTACQLTVERRMSRKRVPKSKGREKITERFRDRVLLSLKVDPQRYEDLAALPQRTPPPPAPLQVLAGTAQGDRARAVLVTPEARTLTVRGATSKSGHELLAGGDALASALVWMYGGLSTLRR